MFPIKHAWSAGAAIVAVLVCQTLAAQTQPVCKARVQDASRIALVIGNAEYVGNWGPLKNPLNDAREMAMRLCELGFDVRLYENADLRVFNAALAEFRSRLAEQRDPVAFFYYSGHGTQGPQRPPGEGVDTYLVPVRAQDFATTQDAPSKAVGLEQVVGTMRAGLRGGTGIVVLDACRNAGLPSGFKSASKGLAEPRPTEDFLIAYATRAGAVALDGRGSLSPYTAQLVEHLQNKPGEDLSLLLKQVRQAVISATGNRQQPQVLDMSSRPVVLLPAVPVAGELVVSSQPSGAEIYVDGVSRGTAPLKIAGVPSDKTVSVRAVLPGYTNAEERVLVDSRRPLSVQLTLRAEVGKARLIVQSQPGDARIAIIGGPEYRPNIELTAGAYDIEVSAPGYQSLRRTYSLNNASETITVQLVPAQSSAVTGINAATSLEIEMVEIPAGTFEMGATANDREAESQEKPRHRVSVKSFRLAKYEITVAQWLRYQLEAGSASAGCGTVESNPVACVTWPGVQAYIRWLNRKTGKRYRCTSGAVRA